MKIANNTIEKGERKLVQIPVAELINGEYVLIEAEIFRAKKDGPVVLFSAGMHGDEVTGVETLIQALKSKMFEELEEGTVIVIPMINEVGFNRGERTVGGKDINRCFPGREDGSLASIIAHTISKEILPVVDYGIDFHSGAVGIYNYPQIRVTDTSREATKLSILTKCEVRIRKKVIEGSMREYAAEQGKIILVFEGGEATRLDPLSVEEGLKYMKNLLNGLGMTKTKAKPTRVSKIFVGSSWQRSPVAGVFKPVKKAGDDIGSRETYAHIDTIANDESIKARSNKIGTIIGMRTTALVNKGDALCNVAYL